MKYLVILVIAAMLAGCQPCPRCGKYREDHDNLACPVRFKSAWPLDEDGQ